MKTHTIQSAREFIDLAGETLLMDEVRHGLIYGIAEKVNSDSHAYGNINPWFVILEDDDQLCAAALRTPPHGAILAHISGALEPVVLELVQSIHSIDPTTSGVVGEKRLADQFAEKWCEFFDRKVKDFMAQLIYRLTELIEPKLAKGYNRKATKSDEELVISWANDFQIEALGENPSSHHREQYIEKIENGEIYLWEDVVPLSMAAKIRPSKHGISIGAVYTPPKYRFKGYATSCVAMLCKELLQMYDFCVLYTDLANPVSNSIYQRIGFREYCDSAQYNFA